jgi:hypothetical protein
MRWGWHLKSTATSSHVFAKHASRWNSMQHHCLLLPGGALIRFSGARADLLLTFTYTMPRMPNSGPSTE